MTGLAEAATAGKLFGAMVDGHAAPAAEKNALDDVVPRHFNGENPIANAAKELAAAIAAAQ
jgi:hypothetical protein